MSAEAAADHARARGARVAQPGHGALYSGRRGVVEVAQARVRGVEQRAHRGQVARAQRGVRGVDARVLLDHVAHAPVQRIGQPPGVVGARLAQRLDAEHLGGPRALGPARVVARLAVRVGLAGVDGDQPPVIQRERDVGDVDGAEVDAQRVALAGEQRRGLVEQAGLRAHPAVLDARADPRERQAVDVVGVRQRQQREAQRALQRGRRRQPGARGHVAGDLELDRGDGQARGGELGHRAAHEGTPAARGWRGVEREAVLLADVESARHDLLAVARLSPHRDPEADRERQAEPGVVVGVLADEVDAPGCEGDRDRADSA